MKRVISVFLAIALMAAMTGCGSATQPETTAPAATVEGTMEELMTQLLEQQPVEFSGVTTVLDLSDTSENGLWALKSYTGLDSADSITDAAVHEPMIGSIAFSLVLARVADGADPQTVAQAMKDGVDPRKWVCVGADEVQAAGFADVVMLVMVSTATDLNSQSFVDAFQSVAGGLDFTI